MFTHVYICLTLFARVSLSLPPFTRVYLCLHLSTYVYRFSRVYVFTRV